MLYKNIKKLIQYGIGCGLLPERERVYATNLLLALFQEDGYEDIGGLGEEIPLEDVLQNLLDEACARGLIENDNTSRDLFDTKIMNCLTPRPAQVTEKFYAEYKVSPKKATDYFYALSQNSDYIRTYRVKKDERWTADSPYGAVDITINLSKPEKDPKAIAAERNAKGGGYPKCLLCMENEGYAGRVNHPARENHRIVPIKLCGEEWGLQYSPYVYYNEHCIVLSKDHVPMEMSGRTLERLIDFTDQFPHYFLGANADLPIVGGSILSHDHFQGGSYIFPMAKAEVGEYIKIKGHEGVEAGIVNWPMSVIRLKSRDGEGIVALGAHILDRWRGYTDEEAFIFAATNGEPHNTITPIARKRDGFFEIDLILRNNITTDEHPLGVYHPHSEYHHIKKENIGLIEAMGLAILPARLKGELELVSEFLIQNRDLKESETVSKHGDWADGLRLKYGSFSEENAAEILRKEVGLRFVKILENAGVYKSTPEGRAGFERFIDSL